MKESGEKGKEIGEREKTKGRSKRGDSSIRKERKFLMRRKRKTEEHAQGETERKLR